MKNAAGRELMAGLFVLAGLAALGYLSINIGGLNFTSRHPMHLYATFNEIGGLHSRAPVVISGVKVGQVDGISLNQNLRARVTLVLSRHLKLPIDSSASIQTAGLLGDQYIEIEPGADTKYLRNGDTVAYTQDAITLEGLIGKFVHNVGLGDGQ